MHRDPSKRATLIPNHILSPINGFSLGAFRARRGQISVLQGKFRPKTKDVRRGGTIDPAVTARDWTQITQQTGPNPIAQILRMYE
jgi:hypothetical protein